MSIFWSTTDPQMTRKTPYSHCMASIAISPYNPWYFSLYKKTKVARQACFKGYQDDLHTLEYDLEDNLYPWKMTCIAIFVHKQRVSEELSCPRNHDLHALEDVFWVIWGSVVDQKVLITFILSYITTVFSLRHFHQEI